MLDDQGELVDDEKELDRIRNLVLRSGCLTLESELRFLSLQLSLAHCLEWAAKEKGRASEIFVDFLKIEKRTTEFVWSLEKKMSAEDHLLLRALVGRRNFVLKERLSELIDTIESQNRKRAGISYPRRD